MTKLRTLTILMAALLLTMCFVGSGAAEFDREQCLSACRGRFMGPGTLSYEEPSYVAQGRPYERCAMECERRFWQDFDRKTRETERGQ